MEQPAQKQPPFYEQRWFQGAVALVGLLTAVWALIGAPKPWNVGESLVATKLPLSNTEIVLDTSTAMAKPFGKETKLEAATDAIAKYSASASNTGLALRETGGGCYDDGSVAVGFGAGHNDDVREAVAKAHPAGVSNVISTVRGAIDEFTLERFRDSSSTRRIVVFMGGEDRCVEAAGEEIRDALDGMGVDTTFRMYALGLSRKEAKNMSHFMADVKPYAKVEFWPVENEKDLDEAIEREAKEIAAGEVPTGLNPIAAEIEEEESLEPQGEGVEPSEQEEETETTPEEEEPAEEESTEEEPSEEPAEEESEEPLEEEPPAEPTSPSSSEVGAVPGAALYAVNRTGSVFSWLRKADSANLGVPARAMFG
jgi:hypothetical protein